MRVNHSAGRARRQLNWSWRFALARRTVRLSFAQGLRQVHTGLSNELRLSGIIRVAEDAHDLPALDLLLLRLFLWRRRRRRGSSFGSPCKLVFYVLVQLEADFFVPFWMLASALDRLRTADLCVQFEGTVWVLLAYMSLIGEVFLFKLRLSAAGSAAECRWYVRP